MFKMTFFKKCIMFRLECTLLYNGLKMEEIRRKPRYRFI